MEPTLPINNTPESVSSSYTGTTTIENSENVDFISKLDAMSLESLAEVKLSRFFDMIGTNYPENFHKLIMSKTEKPLIAQVLKRKGGNQVQTANVLGINRNTLRKKMKLYGL